MGETRYSWYTVQNAFSYRRVSIAKLYLYGAGVLYVDANEKRRVLKDLADYRPASNSYPSQLYGGMNDAPGPSEFVRSLGIRFALRILSFISGTYIGNSTDRRRRGGPKKNEPEMMKQPSMKDPLGPSTTRIGIMYTGEYYLNAYLIINSCQY